MGSGPRERLNMFVFCLTPDDIKFLNHLIHGPKTLHDLNREWPSFGRLYNVQRLVLENLIIRDITMTRDFRYTITFKGRMLLATHEKIA
jgi:hypothetical protein